MRSGGLLLASARGSSFVAFLRRLVGSACTMFSFSLRLWPGRSLFLKVALLAWSLVFLTLLIPSVLTIRSHRELLESKLLEHGVAITETMSTFSEEPFSRGEVGKLRALVSKLVADDRQLSSALVVDGSGNVLAHSDPFWKSKVALDLREPPETRTVEKGRKWDGSPVIKVTTPIRLNGEAQGSFRTEFALSVLDSEMERAVRRVLLTGIVIFAVGTAAAGVVARTISCPVSRLASLASEIARGNLDVRCESKSQDEIGALARAFDGMAVRIATASRELQSHSAELEKKVAERTQALEQNAVALIQARDAAETANKTKSAFLANMSHELRTPLHGVLSYANFGITKIDTVDRERLLRYFGEIKASAETLLVLLNDLLDLAKLEAGKMNCKMGNCDLQDVISTITSEFAPAFKEKRLKVEVLPLPPNPTAVCDTFRITQVLRNLVSNAVKFTEPDKSITVSVEDRVISVEGFEMPGVAVSVADEGIGVPEGELEFIFSKFAQSSKTDTGSGGTGLGLAICKEIVTAHGGSIEARNNPTGGATFTFAIPRRQSLVIKARPARVEA